MKQQDRLRTMKMCDNDKVLHFTFGEMINALQSYQEVREVGELLFY